MKYQISILALIFTLFLSSCAPTSQTSGVWINKEKIQGKSYKAIFIYVSTLDIQARSYVESSLANGAIKRGFVAVKSIDVLPPSLDNPALPTKESLAASIQKSACDAVFTVTLLKKEEEMRYTPGTTAYAPTNYYRWGGNLWGYYDYWQPTVSTPGYYNNEKQYFIQSNLFDAKTEELMVSVQSKIYNPSSLQSFSKEYLKDVLTQLEKEGLLKK